jgi:hypothetical protein
MAGALVLGSPIGGGPTPIAPRAFWLHHPLVVALTRIAGVVDDGACALRQCVHRMRTARSFIACVAIQVKSVHLPNVKMWHNDGGVAVTFEACARTLASWAHSNQPTWLRPRRKKRDTLAGWRRTRRRTTM